MVFLVVIILKGVSGAGVNVFDFMKIDKDVTKTAILQRVTQFP